MIAGGTQNKKYGPKTGVVRVYKWSKSKWTQIGKNFYGIGQEDYLGYSVDLNYRGDIIAIGAPGNNNTGSFSGEVRIYKYVKQYWLLSGNPINGKVNDRLGSNVALNSTGTFLAANAHSNSDNGEECGKVSAYELKNTKWTQLGDSISGQNSLDWFGSSVDMNAIGSTLIIGSYGNDSNGQESGQTRIFKK